MKAGVCGIVASKKASFSLQRRKALAKSKHKD